METVFKKKSFKSDCRKEGRMESQISSGLQGKNTFGCEICGKSLTTKKTLTQHISAIHEGK